jgi:glycosyltransferase involved in cell wall biosynthesis
MKIAYLGQMADVSRENGIVKKIRQQAGAWLTAGHEVRYFGLEPTTAVWTGLAPVGADLVARGAPWQRPFRSRQLAARIRAWRPDVVYFRYAYHSAGLPALFRDFPTVAELNSDDLTEYPLTLSQAKVLYHRLTRARVLGRMAGFVAVTGELATRFAAFGRPTEVIANGIPLADFAPLPVPPAGAAPRLLFVGSAGSPWHGLERVAELATLLPEVSFDLVGCARPAGAWPDNVVFHGALPAAAYAPLATRATAALGTLALYRKSMDEACPLKVREYLALGLPVIAAYRDTDFPADADFFLRLPNDERPLAPHRERIAAWLRDWHGRRVPRAAVQHLDAAAKETRRLAFLSRFATGSRP